MNRTFSEQLARDGFLLQQTRGISMEPMLRQGRDLSLIKPPEVLGRELKRGDVVLFRRGKDWVLHRILGRRGQVYRIRGDNAMGVDLVPPQQIVGVLTGFYRGEVFVDCLEDRAYLRYVRRRLAGFPIRWAVFRFKCLGKTLLRKFHRTE